MRSEILPSILLTPLVSESAGELERDPPVAHFNSRACSSVGLLQSLQKQNLGIQQYLANIFVHQHLRSSIITQINMPPWMIIIIAQSLFSDRETWKKYM
jgi:hypothetical protein